MIQLKEGFVLRTVAGEHMVIPSGDDLDLNMMITLNETGKFLWELIGRGVEQEELAAALSEEYDVDEQTATEHANRFVGKLRENGFLK